MRGIITVNLDTIKANVLKFKRRLSENAKIIGVVKADGYGHGAKEIAKYVGAIDSFAVASTDEGEELRAVTRKPVIILGYDEAERAIRYDLTPTVWDKNQVKEISRCAEKLGKMATVAIAVDTGMSRVGFQVNEFSVSEIKTIAALPNIEIRGMFTHFAVSDMKDKTFTREQYGHFRWMCKRMEEEGIHIALRHCCNSAAVLELPEYYCDMVRPGIIMYGCEPSPEIDIKPYDLRPVMSLRCCIAHVKLIDAGATVSYGRHYKTPSRRKIATLPVGYADGYSRILSGKVDVLYHGHRVPQVGAICMDQCMIDVSGEANVHAGDEVVLFGRQGDSFIPIEEIAAVCGTINYEIMCNISRRVPRVYMKNGKVVGREEYLFDKP